MSKAVDDSKAVAVQHAVASGETKTVVIHEDGKDITIVATPDGQTTITEAAASPFDPPKR